MPGARRVRSSWPVGAGGGGSSNSGDGGGLNSGGLNSGGLATERTGHALKRARESTAGRKSKAFAYEYFFTRRNLLWILSGRNFPSVFKLS